MFDFLSGMGGSLTSILPTFSGLTQGAGSLLGSFFGEDKPENPLTMPNIQQPGGNYLLDNMTPEVAGVFQGMGVKPEGFAMQPTQQEGLLNQGGGTMNIQAPQAPVFNAPPMPVYNEREQIQPVDLQQYYRNLMSSRQGIL
tara:strand:+ start:89 stop:511 length:423 start_codon:yes stop_codon:yes gene_type:complete